MYKWKLVIHSLSGFSNHMKNCYIQNYNENCRIENASFVQIKKDLQNLK